MKTALSYLYRTFVFFLSIQSTSCVPTSPEAKPTNATAITSLRSSNESLELIPWRNRPYKHFLTPDYHLDIFSTKPYTHEPSPSVALIEEFINNFCENLSEKYPAPALAPREAGQSEYDPESYSKWSIRERVITGGRQPPTDIIIRAALALEGEIAVHGPPAQFHSWIVGRDGTVYSALELEIHPLVPEMSISLPAERIGMFRNTS